ncbi:hypothetical protein [Halogeometricum borinquense]|uniref:hypothetical protein n=1 Tax=Halogeometricum borinquense TaxID=60847 RepID=UPI001F5DC289|nr:hypothetical protein [Halogeometricum borinquense]
MESADFDYANACIEWDESGVSKQRAWNQVVAKMLRKRVVGSHNKTVDTIVNMSLPSHEQGRGQQLLEDMVSNPNAPVEAYGGQRDAVRLTDVSDAVDYLKVNDGDVPFGFD